MRPIPDRCGPGLCHPALIKFTTMPPRLTDIAIHAAEGIALGLLALYNGTRYVAGLISDEDWQKITGPHGVAFLAVTACIVLWLNGLRREKIEEKRRSREEAAREARHAENIAVQREAKDEVKALVVECVKSNAMVTAAITSIDKNNQRLTVEIENLKDAVEGCHAAKQSAA